MNMSRGKFLGIKNRGTYMFKFYKPRGFTLTELLIVLAIMSILAAVAIPGYQRSVASAKRADATTALISFAQALERRFSETNSYCDFGTTVVTGCGVAATGDSGAAASVFATSVPTDGGDAYYNLTISSTNLSAVFFQVEATRTGSMAGDSCGELIYTSVGQKIIKDADTGVVAADCW